MVECAPKFIKVKDIVFSKIDQQKQDNQLYQPLIALFCAITKLLRQLL